MVPPSLRHLLCCPACKEELHCNVVETSRLPAEMHEVFCRKDRHDILPA